MQAKDLLLEKYLAWQQKEGDRKSMSDFAAYLGISSKYLSMIWNGHRPLSKTVAPRLAHLFDDARFYDVAGLPRPDPILKYVTKNWGLLDDAAQNRIADEVGKYTTEPKPEK